MAAHPIPTVLIIEDNPLNMKIFTALTDARGCNVLEAQDGFVGLALAQEHQPGLIIMDWQLPGISGLHLVHALKEDKRTRAIPVVIVTAQATTVDDDPYIRAAKCDGFLAKPITVAGFLKMLDSFLQ